MKKFYITTSIIYANANPHIGHALEFIQADVLARYHRSLNDDVFFLTGTDEHGTKIFKRAQELGKNVQEFVDEISASFQDLTKKLAISNDYFIRTSDQKKHWPTVNDFWQRLEKNGDLYKKKYQGKYCSGCESFINAKDEHNGKCSIHNKELELVEEENYFFKLSKYKEEVKKVIKSGEYKIIPETRKNEVLALIDDLEDVSFSRSREKLNWGIPVPGDNSQTIYVWVEALINYISAIDGEKSKYWPADVHCIGKDILKFHAIIWPAILLALKIKLPKKLFIHGFITVNSQKMSKSLGNVVDPFELVNKYGVDAVRYYLLREFSSTEDGDFTIKRFEERYNADLASGIGNLVSRVFTMAKTGGFEDGDNKKINSEIKKTKAKYNKALADFKFNEALQVILQLVSFCDRVVDAEKPWENKDNSPFVLGGLLIAIDSIADLLDPFLPETAEKIKEQIARKNTQFIKSDLGTLFPRIK